MTRILVVAAVLVAATACSAEDPPVYTTTTTTSTTTTSTTSTTTTSTTTTRPPPPTLPTDLVECQAQSAVIDDKWNETRRELIAGKVAGDANDFQTFYDITKRALLAFVTAAEIHLHECEAVLTTHRITTSALRAHVEDLSGVLADMVESCHRETTGLRC